jgi:hypothetical protein
VAWKTGEARVLSREQVVARWRPPWDGPACGAGASGQSCSRPRSGGGVDCRGGKRIEAGASGARGAAVVIERS